MTILKRHRQNKFEIDQNKKSIQPAFLLSVLKETDVLDQSNAANIQGSFQILIINL